MDNVYLPIDLLKLVDDWVGSMDDALVTTEREAAIRECARLLIYLTHDEFYHNGNEFGQEYTQLAHACANFIDYRHL